MSKTFVNRNPYGFQTAKESQPSFIMCVFTIDCDYEELIEACDIEYKRYGNDLKIKAYFDTMQELAEVIDDDLEEFCANVFNYEIAESCSKVVIYKHPHPYYFNVPAKEQ